MALERGFGDMNQELEIIQEELQLKLEMHCVKEQFLGLLENYTTYDDGRRPPHATRYIPAQYAYFNPEQGVIPRNVCRCHERTAASRCSNNSHGGSYLQQSGGNLHRVQDSSSSSDEHQRLMRDRQYAHESIEQRVPPVTDYEQHMLQYRQPQVSPTSATSSEEYDKQQNPAHISSSRARVRAFYANRRERLIAQRARHGYLPAPQSAPTPTPVKSTTSYSPGSSSSDMDTFVNHAMNHFDNRNTNTPVLSVCSSSDSRERLLDSDDLRNNNTPPKSAIKEHITPNSTRIERDPLYQNLLIPIHEERGASSRDSSGLYCSALEEESLEEAPELPPRCPLIPPERYREYLSHKSPPDDLGEYVTLKAPEQSMNSFFEDCQSQMAPSILRPDITTMSYAPFAAAMMSMSFTSDTSDKGYNNHREKDSPLREVRYAKSDVISELYTKHDKSLLDVSQISNISSSSIAPSSLSDSTLEQYPLHSTMIAPNTPANRAKQRISFSDDDSLLTRTDDTFDTLDSTLEGEAPGSVLSADSRTTTKSEPSAMLRGPHTTQLSLCSAKSYDGFINDQTSMSTNTPQMFTEDVFKTPKNPPRRHRRSSDGPKPTKLEAKLCKEHGLHAVFGDSPCIFEDSKDLIESDDSDLDFTSINNSEPSSKFSSKRSSLASKRSSWASKMSSKRSSVARNNSVADTDCDSSYLSECVDDTHFTNDFSEPENYTAMYDPRRARMRVMRRQTGHANIKSKQLPIGLSESDILESTQKHLSLHATRASMPDLHGLTSISTYDPYSCEDLSEETLRDSPEKTCFDKSSFKESDIDFGDDYNFDPDETIISRAPSEKRPLSICTTTTQATATTDESPESQGGMTVPVNSPNITDSGGSSSRQPTTDDYVDVPVNLPKMAKMLENRLQSHAQYPEKSLMGAHLGYTKHRTRKRYPGSSAGSSQQSLGSKQSLHICSDPVPEPGLYPSKCRVRTGRKIHIKKYPQSQDSGFNTQDSRARARALQLQQQHYSGHSGQVELTENTGTMRTVAKHASVAKGLDRERKKALAKKLKQFNNNFYGSSSSSLQIKTLGHF